MSEAPGFLDLPCIKPGGPIYFVGDSNTLLYRYLTIDLPAHFARPIVTSACFVPAMSAASIVDGEALDSRIVEYLQRECVVSHQDRRLLLGARDKSLEYRTWLRSVTPPLEDIYNFEEPIAIVLVFGAIDLGFILKDLGTDTDFHLADERFVDASFDGPELPLVPFAMVRELVETRLAPVAKALAILRETGYREIYVHSLHPPTTDDAIYYRARQVMCSAKVRYKVAILINRVMKRHAEENGCRFLDMWPYTVRDGVVDPKFILDGDHLNPIAAEQTLRALLRDVVEKRGIPSAD